MKKWQIALLIIVVVAGGLWFVKVFPENRNVYEWIFNKLHGEK